MDDHPGRRADHEYPRFRRVDGRRRRGHPAQPRISAAQLDRGLLGFGVPMDGCPSCREMESQYNYGLGVVFRGPWIIQNPLFFGGSGVSAYLPERKISIAVANTYGEGAFADDGGYSNGSVPLFEAIAAYLAPGLATPMA